MQALILVTNQESFDLFLHLFLTLDLRSFLDPVVLVKRRYALTYHVPLLHKTEKLPRETVRFYIHIFL